MFEDIACWHDDNPLRKARKSRNLTLAMTAALLSTGISTVQSWEKGYSHPGEASMKKIAAFLKVTTRTAKKKWSLWKSSFPAQVA